MNKPSSGAWTRVLALIGLLAASGALLPGTAAATSFARMSTEQFVDASTYVVRGTVTEVWTEVRDERYVWTHARIVVSERFKGPDEPTELVISSLGGKHGDLELKVPGAAAFSVDQEAIFFLHRATEDAPLVPVSKFLGVRVVRRAPGMPAPYAMTFHPQAAVRYDARFLPHPPEEARVAVAELVSTIRARVAEGWDGQPIPGISMEKLQQVNDIEWRKP